MPGLKLDILVSGTREAWQGLVGRFDFERLRELVPEYLEREIFCCGPPKIYGYGSSLQVEQANGVSVRLTERGSLTL